MRVRMLTSWSERCGIADYSRNLVDALDRLPDLEVRIVRAEFRRILRHDYAAQGEALNGGDVAHVQHSAAFFGGFHPLRWAWPACLDRIRKPLLVTLHELDEGPGGWRSAYLRRLNRRSFAVDRIGAYVVHARSLAAGLMGLGVEAERIHLLPMPFPPPPERPPDPERVDRELGLAGRQVLLIPGFLARRKGYDIALDALRRLPDSTVLVAAGGEHGADRSGTRDWLEALAERRRVADRFLITGFLPADDLESLIARADLVLAPFLSMSASASLAHAVARGKAIVASDLPEIRSLGGVRLVPAGDPAALASAVEEVLARPDAKEQLVEAAVRCAGRHSYQSLAEETARLYRLLHD